MVDPQVLVGQTIDSRYRLASVVGSGAFGTVFAADEMAFGKVVGQVAVKLLRPPDDATRDAVVSEVQAMAQLSHPHLLAYRSSGEVREGLAKGCLYIAAELASGSLADRLRRPDRMSGEETLVVAGHLSSALAYLHSRHAMHRDVKPANILRVGDAWKLGDFGLVRGFSTSVMQVSGRKGTILYMSPDAMKGEYWASNDVWALGVVLQECLTGTYPYSGTTDVEVITKALTAEPLIAPGLPEPLCAVVRGCLCRDRAGRWAADQVGTALLVRAAVSRKPSRPASPHTVGSDRCVVLKGHRDQVRAVAFSPDGRSALTGSLDGTACLWDVATGSVTRTLAVPPGWFPAFASGPRATAVEAVAFAPDGRRVVTGHCDRVARLWDVASGGLLHTLRGHRDSVDAVALSPDGQLAVTGSGDTSARLWDVESGRQVQTFRGHLDRVVSVAFLPDGQHVVSGGWDASARLWAVDSGRQMHVLVECTPVDPLHGQPERRRAFTVAEMRAELTGPSAGRRLPRGDRHVRTVVVSPDGLTVLTGGWDPMQRFTASGFPLSPTMLIGADPDYNPRDLFRGTGTARLWSVASGLELSTVARHETTINTAVFSTDGRSVVTGSDDLTARIWEVGTGQELQVFSGHTGSVRSVAFSPDGKLVMTGSADGTARIWKVEQ